MLIATFVLERGYSLLHSDTGYDPFEKELGLQVLGAGGAASP